MQYEKAEQDISSKETLRLEKLRNYEILNTAAESAFDQISQLAAEIFDVPYAGICFQGDGIFFVKSEVGEAALEIIQDITQKYNIPIVYNFPAGHIPDNRALVFGRQVALEVSENGTVLKFE